jgi:hypothetical protein
MAYRAMTLVAVSTMLVACSQPNAPDSRASPPSAETEGISKQLISEEEVRQDLVDEGYGQIYDLRPQPDGSWTAIAMLDGRQRQVMITPDGFIFPR